MTSGRREQKRRNRQRRALRKCGMSEAEVYRRVPAPDHILIVGGIEGMLDRKIATAHMSWDESVNCVYMQEGE